jgi:hypothetical protein
MERTIVALDISSKPGWAYFRVKDGEVQHLKFDTIFPKKTVKDYGNYPFNYLEFAREVGGHVVTEVNLIHINHPEVEVVIEETTKGKNNYSQKMLEFLHYSVLSGLQTKHIPVVYIRTGIWRGKVGANLTNEEKRLNAKIRRIKRTTGKRLAKIDGKVAGLITKKHAALRCFKDHFGYPLPLSMNDACDAVLLGMAYIRGVPACDGTMFGGVKEEEE